MQAALAAFFSEQEELAEHAGPRVDGTPPPALKDKFLLEHSMY